MRYSIDEALTDYRLDQLSRGLSESSQGERGHVRRLAERMKVSFLDELFVPGLVRRYFYEWRDKQSGNTQHQILYALRRFERFCGRDGLAYFPGTMTVSDTEYDSPGAADAGRNADHGTQVGYGAQG